MWSRSMVYYILIIHVLLLIERKNIQKQKRADDPEENRLGWGYGQHDVYINVNRIFKDT